MADTELLINLRNGQRAERETVRVRAVLTEDPAIVARRELREEALLRLQAKAARDETLADLLTVLGLV